MLRISLVTLLCLTAVLGLNSLSQAQRPLPPVMKLGDPLPANLFIELAKIVNPAVVNISTSTTPRMGRPGSRDPYFDMLEQMFGFRMMPQQSRPQMALGTGFIIREDGLIITNNHVIAGADVIQVQLSEDSDKKLEAKVIGSDDRTDIALIKIEGKSFPTVQLGASNETQVGEWVAAFGNPFGNGHTMTKGIISAKGRDIGELNRFPLMQTDAPINPGNSGGPLVNSRGQVIGVNSAIDARAQGIGFAIPIDEVKSILPQLEKTGRIKMGYLGVGLADLDPQTALALGLQNLEGAVIAQVERNSPAEKGGLQPYDVVTEINEKKIRSSNELRNQIADTPVGREVKMRVLREGRPRNLSVVIGEKKERLRNNSSETREMLGARAPYNLGFMVADPNSELRKQFNLESDVQRPIIVQVSPGSPAARAGLLSGDIVLDINRKDVVKTTEFLKLIKAGTNTLRISRQGSTLFLVLRSE